MTTQRIGFIGLGIMGRGMVKNLVEKGFFVTLWNRTKLRAVEFASELTGAHPVAVAESPQALAQLTDIVFCCVKDPAAVEEVVFGPNGVLSGARPGFRYVECSTVTPELVQRIAKAFEAIGAGAMEAPVTGSKLGAQSGSLVFITGGPTALHEELLPVLSAMGKKFIHCGPSGHAAMIKLVGNSTLSFMLEGLAEGLVVAQKFGVDLSKVLEVVQSSGYASPFFAWKGGNMLSGDFDTHFSVDLLVKDQTLMLAEAARQSASMPALAAIREVFQSARGQGLGDQDISSVIEVLRAAAGIKTPPSNG